MKKKKYIKKIILCISLVAVLVSSMVIPSFAYTHSNIYGTFYEFMGETDLNKSYNNCYNLHQRSCPEGYYTYDYYNDTYTNKRKKVYMTTFDPGYSWGNSGKFNGCVTFSFGPEFGVYTVDLGYFDLTIPDRFQSCESMEGTIKVDLFDLDYLAEFYNEYGTMPSYAQHYKWFFEEAEYVGYEIPEDHFLVCFVTDEDAFDYYLGSSGCWTATLYPSIGTCDDIYRIVKDDYARVKASNNTLTSENESLKSANASLTEANNSLSSANSDLQLKYDQALSDQFTYADEIQGLKSANAELTAKNKELVETNKILVNNNGNLKESLGNINSLTALFNGIGQGFTNIIDSISSLGIGGITIGACITVAVVIFVVFIIIKLVLR